MNFAQQSYFSTGLEAGPSLICLKEKYHGYFSNTGYGFSASIFFQFNAKRIFSLKIASGFERKGAYQIDHSNFHYNLNYFVITLLLKAEYGSKVKGFICAGPFGGYLLTAYYTADYLDEPVDYMKYFKKIDAGISAGLGITIPVKKKFCLSIECRNNFGLVQIIIPEEEESSGWNWKTFSTNLIFSFSYNFQERKRKSD